MPTESQKKTITIALIEVDANGWWEVSTKENEKFTVGPDTVKRFEGLMGEGKTVDISYRTGKGRGGEKNYINFVWPEGTKPQGFAKKFGGGSSYSGRDYVKELENNLALERAKQHGMFIMNASNCATEVIARNLHEGVDVQKAWSGLFRLILSEVKAAYNGEIRAKTPAKLPPAAKAQKVEEDDGAALGGGVVSSGEAEEFPF